LQAKSRLPPTKLNAEKIKVLKLVARGWKRLAGGSKEDIEALIDAVGDAGTKLYDNRKGTRGRQWDSKEKALIEPDRAVMIDIRAGMKADDAIRKTYGEGADFEANQRRIARLREEELEIIALQVSENGH
jgi:hypothetical protein